MTPLERQWLALPIGARTLAELVAVTLGFSLFTVLLTYPLAFHLGTLGYKLGNVGDPQYSVWNVAWVAHALLEHPRRVLDANIFFPHPTTLIYSEPNLVAGVLGTPAYWLTADPYATHNSVVLISFVMSGTACYYLVRYITDDRRASVIAAIGFAYCPFVLSHLSHIQLLMTAGIPLSLLAFHRLADRPAIWKGVVLGLAMGLQALACAYYGAFLSLVIPLAIAMTALRRRLWTVRSYWVALIVAAFVAMAVVAPVFMAYMEVQRDFGFMRELSDARQYSANVASYVTSSMYASAWLHRGNITWTDVLFPGFIAVAYGAVTLLTRRRFPSDQRYYIDLYGAMTAFAVWQSFGPMGGLYTLTYHVVPFLNFLRAPSRFGILVTLGLSVLAAGSMARWFRYVNRPAAWALVLIAAAASEHALPITLTANPTIAPVYRFLASLPDGGVIEFPLFSRTHQINRTVYMISSTAHWKPLVNAYSDITPAAFDDNLDTLADFPSDRAFAALKDIGPRYAVFHLEAYRRNGNDDVLERALTAFSTLLTPLYRDESTALYAIAYGPWSPPASRDTQTHIQGDPSALDLCPPEWLARHQRHREMADLDAPCGCGRA